MTDKITASVVSEQDRIDFLPALFGPHFLAGEDWIYSYARVFCADYRDQGGGYWEYVALSNGGRYARPVTDLPEVSVSVRLNQYRGSMSPDAFGIVATIYALATVWEKTRQDELVDAMDLLKDFAVDHAERWKIVGAID